MADDPAETETEQETSTPEPQGEDRVSRLEDKVDHLIEQVKGLFTGGGKTEAEAEPQSVGEEIKRELARLKQAEDRKKTTAEKDAELARLKEQVKKLAEKPPKEYRKITQRIWGPDE